MTAVPQPPLLGRIVGLPGTTSGAVVLWDCQDQRGSPLLLSGDGGRVGVAPIMVRVAAAPFPCGYSWLLHTHTPLCSMATPIEDMLSCHPPPRRCACHSCHLSCLQESDVASRAVSWRLANSSLGVGEDAQFIIDATARIKCLAVLPLRRLLLVGADDGVVRVCS